MIRALIGTFAVLAGFAMLEASSDASPGPAGWCKATEVHALLRPGEPAPVRAAPTPESAVLGVLVAREFEEAASAVATLTGSRKGWARIALDSKNYAAIESKPHLYGWVPADLLAVNTRLDGGVTVYDRPGLLGSAIGRIENEDQAFRVLGCRGDLLQVINPRQGAVWIDRWCARSEGCRGH